VPRRASARATLVATPPGFDAKREGVDVSRSMGTAAWAIVSWWIAPMAMTRLAGFKDKDLLLSSWTGEHPDRILLWEAGYQIVLQSATVAVRGDDAARKNVWP